MYKRNKIDVILALMYESEQGYCFSMPFDGSPELTITALWSTIRASVLCATRSGVERRSLGDIKTDVRYFLLHTQIFEN